MIQRLLLILLLSKILAAFNFSPLPKSFTNTIKISPKYGVFSFQEITFNPSNGDASNIYNTYGIGIKWGEPFNGYTFEMDFITSLNILKISSTNYTKTFFNTQMFKLRYFYKIIDDGYGKMALLTSIGKFQGDYVIQNISESTGVNSYVERLLAGTLIDAGVAFSYMLNPEWEVFLMTFYQVSFDEIIMNVMGTSVNGDSIDLTGASIQIGTSLEL